MDGKSSWQKIDPKDLTYNAEYDRGFTKQHGAMSIALDRIWC